MALTVAHGTTANLTVTGIARRFTVAAIVGLTIVNALLREDGSALLTESGDLILF